MKNGALLYAGLAGAVVGGVTTGLGFAVSVKQAIFSYFAAYSFAVTIGVGALMVLMVGHASNAAWFVVLRRLSEHVVSVLPLLLVLSIPVLLFTGELYAWAGPLDALEHHAQEAVERKRWWTNEPFFRIRAVFCLLSFIVFGELLRRWSLAQDGRPPDIAAALRVRLVRVSLLGLVVVSLTLSLVAFDWVMSLDPLWISNILGVRFFAGGFGGALALVAIMLFAARRGVLREAVSAEHSHAIGRLTFAFVVFWAYITFCQLLLIWIADLPEEVRWYLNRRDGGWQYVGIALIFGRFLVPFFLLISRPPKKHGPVLAAIGVWILLFQFVDNYWMVLPTLHPGAFRPHWLDLTALLGVVGACVAFCAWRARGLRPYPMNDPLVGLSLTYRSPYTNA